MNNKEFDRTKLPVIELTPLESKIVELIKLYINTHNNEYKQDPIVCRIAGGWVRDKLLNIPSNDIDISIENKTISGEAFLNNLIGFYKSNEMRLADYNEKVNSTYTLDDIFPKNVHTTKVNPDKSKHLETAIATIFDQSIDFVALRKEVYDDSLNNRIPFIELGTPLDDALRRDCTLNSLFYNINEGILEDFTGKGVSDLFEGIIRTPLSPPLRTFMDDPLRIFRLLRFKNKYGFKFADNLVSCFIEDNQLLQNHIVRKISRERIALEVNKILSYNDLLILTNFLKDVLQFNLSRFLYSNNNETYTDNDLKKKIVQSKKTMQVDDIKVHESTLKWLIECLPLELESFLANPFLMGLGQTIEKTILMHTVLLLPLYASGMSFSVKDVDFLLISNNIPKQTIRKILQIQSVLIKEDLDFEDMSRAELGNFIKEMTEIANFTNYITILNLLQPEKYKMLIAKLKLHKFDSYALDQLWSPTTFKPLLNGNEIKQRLNKKPGKWLKDVMDMQWNYIFNNQLDLETDSDKSANEAKNKNQFFVWLETSSVKF
ncbi:hypothetical protein QEN19_001787 [Hanseniaspora menglaensis]